MKQSIEERMIEQIKSIVIEYQETNVERLDKLDEIIESSTNQNEEERATIETEPRMELDSLCVDILNTLEQTEVYGSDGEVRFKPIK